MKTDNTELETLADRAADLHADQQAMPDDGALETHRELIREAFALGWNSAIEAVNDR